jgi:hypothetical protein
MKLDVEFSRMGGLVGGNQWSFVDEVVVYTRRSAPLIGVMKWKDIDVEVKKKIASDVMVSFAYFWSIPILFVK